MSRPHGSITATLEERLWEKVDKRGPDECWLWTGHTNPKGYGWLYHSPGRYALAHRTAWEMTNGPVPAGLLVCHHCDVPACCNPAHLFAGTAAENSADMVRKGRAADTRGERSGKAKLRDAEVAEILRLREARVPIAVVAERFGISKSYVSTLVSRHRRYQAIAYARRPAPPALDGAA